MNINHNSFVSIDEMQDKLTKTIGKKNKPQASEENSISFDEILQDTASEVKFSKHAVKRLDERNISLSTNQKQRLDAAANQAMEKGMKESLVMLDDMAFILNVNNKTVVTALNPEQSVFTNIDGAIIS